MPQHFVSLSVFICVATCFKPINLMQHCNIVCSSKIHQIWINILSPGGCRRPFCSKRVTLSLCFPLAVTLMELGHFSDSINNNENLFCLFLLWSICFCVWWNLQRPVFFQEDPRYGEGTVSIKEALMSLLDGSDADETFLQKWYGNVYCCCDQSGTSGDMGALQSVALRCVRTVNYVELHSWAPVKKSCQIFMTTMSIRSVDNWKWIRDHEKAEVQ